MKERIPIGLKGLLAAGLYIFLALTMAALTMAPAAAAEAETPVKTSPWAKETVDRATELGLLSPLYVTNKEDFTVPITRNEFCELAVSYVELQNHLGGYLNEMMATYQYERNAEGKYVVPFTDLANYAVSNRGCVPYTAYYLGIALGDNNHAYNGASSIVREEAAAMLFRAYAACGGELPETAAELTFSDKDTIQDWAKDNVAALLKWNVMNGKENGNFDPRGLCTYEQAVAMFLRLYDNAPLSRVQGNVELIFPYDECMEYLQNTEVSYYRVVDTVEGPVATYVRCNTSGMMHSSSSLLLVYRNGGIQQIDTGIRVGMSGIPSGAKVENAQFSEDGKTFSCDVGIEDSYPDMSGQVSVVYHVTVNVDTLKTVVTQSSTTPV